MLLAAIIAYAPVVHYGYPANGWDSRYHGIVARLFSEQLWQGDLYPRWMMRSNGGLGSPHFFYYAPLGYYVAAAFQWLGNSTALAQLGAGAVLLGFVSGATCYAWLRCLLPVQPALAGAILYLASPYHLFVDLLVRADYAEFAAMAFTPLLLLGVERVRAQRRDGILLIGAGLAAVTLANVVAGLVACGLPMAYAACRCWRRPGALRVLAIVLAASGLGLAMTSIYLLPALADRPAAMVPVWPMPEDVFIFGDTPHTALIRFIRYMFIGYAALTLAVGVMLRRQRRLSEAAAACLIMSIIALALTTIWARPLWMMIPTSWTIQMSYRLFIIIDLCTACLVACAAACIGARWGHARVSGAVGAAAIAAALAGAAVARHSGVFEYDAKLWSERAHYAADYGLFRPRTVQGKLPDDALPLYNGGAFTADVPLANRIAALPQGARADVGTWAPRHIQMTVQAAAAGEIAVGQLYFPGWQAVDTRSGAVLPLRASGTAGLVTVAYPAGGAAIDLRLARLWPEQAGLVVSIVAMIGLFGLSRKNVLFSRKDPKDFYL